MKTHWRLILILIPVVLSVVIGVALLRSFDKKPDRNKYRALPTGAHPFGYSIHNGILPLEIHNDTPLDAVVIVIRIDTSYQNVRDLFVQSHEAIQVNGLAEGNYKLHITYGLDWDSSAKKFNDQNLFHETDPFYLRYREWSENNIRQSEVINGRISLSKSYGLDLRLQNNFVLFLVNFLFFGIMFSVGIGALLFWIVPQYQQTYPESKIADLVSIFYLKKDMLVSVFFVGFDLWLICYVIGYSGYLVSAASMGCAYFIVKYLARLAGSDVEESLEDEKRHKEKAFDNFFK
jgi:hypothetical protein